MFLNTSVLLVRYIHFRRAQEIKYPMWSFHTQSQTKKY
jgi:hypothetical protein